MRRLPFALLALIAAVPILAQNDEEYGKKIKEATTEPFFLTELVDHLPASATVPSPLKHFGKIAGAPEVLHYVDEINAYYRALDAASDRIQVVSMGKSEEGRDMIVAIISDEANLARLNRLKEVNALLSDPRKLVTGGYKGDGKLTGADAQAEKLLAEALPVYYATGGMHSPESGPPEMLLELAYRLAVQETPFIQQIRKNSIVLLTPVLDPDGRDRYVDTYYYRKRNPNKPRIPLMYWGKYVAHDNNRDSIGISLALSKNLMKTWFDFHPQVMHDLHQSIPYLYISTGTGPYNAWLDPITTDEWHIMAYEEVHEMSKRGVPGVWTHGFYDGWAPNYAFYAANGHNAIGRFYETMGSDADTRVVDVDEDAQRAWYKQNPPLKKVRWSLRNNTNLMQSALLMGMNHVARDKDRFLRNYYQKSKRSVLKPWTEGPAAYVVTPDATKPLLLQRFAKLFELQGVEVSRLPKAMETKDGKFAAGSMVIRLDQPYSRMADMLLDKQFYSSSDPQPYDDTGWTLGPLFNLDVKRVKDAKVLASAAEPWKLGTPAAEKGRANGYLIVEPSSDPFLMAAAWRDTKGLEVLEEEFKVGKNTYPAGSLLISAVRASEPALQRLVGSGKREWLAAKPTKKSRSLAAPKIALIHDWMFTQDEGWLRLALDEQGLNYAYKSVHELRDTARLKDRYDVIILGPSSRTAIVNGRSTVGEAIPWKPMEGLKHLGGPDTSDDIRGGAGLEGVINLKKFVEEGGLLICIGDSSEVPIYYGLVQGVSLRRSQGVPFAGGVFLTERANEKSPVLYGYGATLGAYTSAEFWTQRLSVDGGGGGFGGGFGGGSSDRPSGRGDKNDPDVVQARAPHPEPDDDPDNSYKAPEQPKPEVLLKFAAADKVWLSGGFGSIESLAKTPAVVLCPAGKGNVLLFGINPAWRGETIGSWQLLNNAFANWQNLRTHVPKPAK